MTSDQMLLIPDPILFARDTNRLTDWLQQRGWQMTLLELDTERRRRQTLESVTYRA